MKWRKKETTTKKRGRSRRRKPSAPAAGEESPSLETAQSETAEPEPTPTEPQSTSSKTKARTKRQRTGAKKKEEKKKISRLSKPDHMSLEEWQRALRRQFGREQNYQLKNRGDHRIFSEFDVTNPETKRTYRARIRGQEPGDNHCTCPDFATNTLGTCKHIEFTLAALERKRGGKKELQNGYQPSWSEVFLHYGAQREVRFRPGTDCSAELARLAGSYFDDEGALLPNAFSRFEIFLKEARKLEEDLQVTDDVVGFVAELRDAASRREKVSGAFRRGAKSAGLKKLLKIPLYNYQKEGALFAARAGRCLIGDEMGLGKTIQAIAAAEIMASLFGVGRVLIVCPTSLKHQWEREIQRFSERSVGVINGLRHKREAQFATEEFFKVTNYDTIHRDLDLIQGWSPDLVILDEAQRIKNWNTRTARSVKQIETPYALVLTGTPLENRLEELISIVQFVDQYRLGPTFRLLHEHQERDEVGRVIGYRDLQRIGKTLEPILIRRHKEEVLGELPERIDNKIFLGMTPRQRKMHDENLEIVARIVQKWRDNGFLSESDQTRLMIALQRMRMSCDSTYLVDHTTDHGFKADEAITILEEVFEDSGTKVVIFSQWKRMLELLERRFKERNWGHVFFHGSVRTSKRKDLIDRFREDPECKVFLSTDSGGTGLNLQHASMVMNMDLPWNPAVLEQRIGRVHRLGQTNPVRVINFVAQGTIEESMLEVLRFKRSLFSGVLDGGASEVLLGGTRLNRFMRSVEKITTSIPEVTLEEADQAYHHAPSEPEGAAAQSGRKRRRAPAAGTVPSPAEDPWGNLLQAGMAILQQVVGAAQAGQDQQRQAQSRKPASSEPGSIVQKDEDTGETYIKLPMPSPEILDQVLQTVGSLISSLRPRE